MMDDGYNEGLNNEAPPPEPPHRGRARERQQRRQERQRMVQPSSARNLPRQISPQGSFKMPKFKLPQNRLPLYAAASILFIVLVVVILGRLRNQPAEVQPNALWVGTEWTYGLQATRSNEAFIRRLRENQIGTLYAWVSWLKPDRTWGGRRDMNNTFVEVEDDVKLFVEDMRSLYPDLELYGWVSVPVGTGGHSLADVEVRQAVADFSSRVITEFGFDGIFLNIEPIWNGDQDFLALIRTVRQAVGTEVPISVAAPPDWSPIDAEIPVPPLIVPGTVWEEDYKQSVGLLVEQIALMAYNSGLSSPADYAEWMAYQVQTFAEAVAALGGGTELLIGIPTYEAELPGHDPLVENVQSAVQGIVSGLELAGEAAPVVRGLAIYAEWTTDEAEWLDFTNAWVRSN